MDLSSRQRPKTGVADRVFLAVSCAAFLTSAIAAARARDAASQAQAAAAEAQRASEATEERIRSLTPRGPGDAERLATRVELNAEAPLPRVLTDLTGLMPDDVRLRSLNVSYGDDVTLDASVEARSPEAWDVFLDRLAASTRFRALSPGPERREGEIRATLRMIYIAEAS
ncbi:MAG TPA: hypothetical protein VKA01_05140 [Vicinamibacteria bacterium]|nr:hypothetical protein [Vicinamibacteria bacterium]